MDRRSFLPKDIPSQRYSSRTSSLSTNGSIKRFNYRS